MMKENAPRVPAPDKSVPAPRRGRRRQLIVLTIFLLLGLALYLFRYPLLRGVAAAWVVNEAPAKSAAIVVLGGGVDTRPFAAARLFKEGYAPKILLPRVKPSPSESAGLTRNDTDIAREVLLREGIPETAIELIGHDVASTFDETEAVRDWIKSQPGGDSANILIPTETFYTRRTRWVFRRTLGKAASPVIIAIPARKYTTDNWWQQEQGLVDFQNECIKLIYYWVKY